MAANSRQDSQHAAIPPAKAMVLREQDLLLLNRQQTGEPWGLRGHSFCLVPLLAQTTGNCAGWRTKETILSLHQVWGGGEGSILHWKEREEGKAQEPLAHIIIESSSQNHRMA